MTTELDRKIVPAVLRAIRRVGVPFTLKPADGAYDAATLTVGAPSAPVTVLASPPVPVKMEEIDVDSRLVAGDTKVAIAGSGLTLTPEVGMNATIFGDEYTVVRVDRLPSGTLTAAWIVFLHR